MNLGGGTNKVSVDYSWATGAVTGDFDASQNSYSVATNSGVDVVEIVLLQSVSLNIVGGTGNDSLEGLSANDVFLGGLGDDTLDGSAGGDILNGGLGNDVIVGGSGTDMLAGSSGRDSLSGSTDADSITGAAGNDTLSGGAGNDVVSGGAGADKLSGGTGGDDFVYARASNSSSFNYDLVQGFDGKSDKLDIWFKVKGGVATLHADKLSTASFDHNLAKAIGANELKSHHVLLFTPLTGGLKGDTFLVIDANGQAGYQSGKDLVIELSHASHLDALVASNFI